MRDDDTHAAIIRARGGAEEIGRCDKSNHVERNMSAMEELRRGLELRLNKTKISLRIRHYQTSRVGYCSAPFFESGLRVDNV
jgi:hypothetical protein